MYHLVLNKTIFTMLLVILGSLVAISSIYTPANVETQPQPQPQKEQTFTTIPGLTTTQSKLTPGQQSQIDQQIFRTLGDNQLLNRLMPEIIKRIDVKLILTQRPGKIVSVEVGDLMSRGVADGQASCPPGETAVSAGIDHNLVRSNPYIWTVKRIPNSNTWDFSTIFEGDGGKLRTYVECLKVELSLKSAPQPQPQQPSPPPGGPPLRPPPEFGK
jgi:hypothetical protein